MKVLRFANRETELKELNAKYQADLAAAQAAGFGTLKITEAYQKQREEINKNYDAKDATAKSEKEKADEEKTLANQQKVLGGLTNYYAKDFALKEDNRKKDEEINKLRLAQQIEQAEAIQGILQNATTVFGKQTAVGKGIAIAEATISTYLGAAKALSGIQKGNPIGAVLAIAQAAAIVANGIKTVKAITAVQVPGGGGAGGSAPSISAPVLPQAATTTLNQGQINQIGNTAARAFVLETDVSGNQERIKRLNRAARIN